MEYDRGHSGTDIQGNITGTKKKEVKTTKSTTNNQLQQPLQEKHHNCRFKKPKPPVPNLSSYTLTKHQISLLSKGTQFYLNTKKDHPAKILQDILLLDRKLRLKYHFHQPISTPDLNTNTTTDSKTNTILKPKFRMDTP